MAAYLGPFSLYSWHGCNVARIIYTNSSKLVRFMRTRGFQLLPLLPIFDQIVLPVLLSLLYRWYLSRQ